MKRLQKRCFWASAGIHGALLLLLLIVPAFRSAPEKKPPVRASKIKLQSSAAIESVLGRASQTPLSPSPEPVKIEPPKHKPKPIIPKSKPKPAPKPKPKPERQWEKRVAEPPKPQPEPEPEKPEIQIDFNKVIRKSEEQAAKEARERERKQRARAAAKRRREMSQTLDRLGGELSGPAEAFDVGLSGSIALGNYFESVRKAYNEAWFKPEGVSSSGSVVKVKVVVNLDGSIASAKIVRSSGIDKLDASVQSALDRVRQIKEKPPEKTSAADRTFTINFRLKDGRIATE